MVRGRPGSGGKGRAWGKGNAWGKSPAWNGGSGGKGHGAGRAWATAWDAPSPPEKGNTGAKRDEASGSGSSARAGLEERLGTETGDEQMSDGAGESGSEEEDGEVKNGAEQ